ncbi:MAG: bacillithiol system redox-active protein YtxJ [Rhodothermales bacterium]|nr:bacillithiol system redox-active protein YtxJ [Rhodothermales bacterium]
MATVHKLETADDLDAMLAASADRPVALLKHSIACPVSARGQQEFVGLEAPDDPPLYVVVVQYARDLSRRIAERLGVRHETPQVIVVKDGEAAYHASHHAIRTEAVREAAREATAA